MQIVYKKMGIEAMQLGVQNKDLNINAENTQINSPQVTRMLKNEIFSSPKQTKWSLWATENVIFCSYLEFSRKCINQF